MEPNNSNDFLLALIERRQRQLLVHSFLYYKCDESIISDHTYDAWYKELVDLQRIHPDIASQTKYYALTRDFDDSGSAFFIKQYPDELVGIAMRLSWVSKGKPEPFDQFIARYGLQIKGCV